MENNNLTNLKDWINNSAITTDNKIPNFISIWNSETTLNYLNTIWEHIEQRNQAQADFLKPKQSRPLLYIFL